MPVESVLVFVQADAVAVKVQVNVVAYHADPRGAWHQPGTQHSLSLAPNRFSEASGFNFLKSGRRDSPADGLKPDQFAATEVRWIDLAGHAL